MEGEEKMDWQPIETAPQDGTEILARRYNDCFHEHYVVWWTGSQPYPWQADGNAYAEGRLDEWMPIPRPPEREKEGVG